MAIADCRRYRWLQQTCNSGPLEKHPSTFFQCVDYVRSFLIMLTFPGPLAEIIKSATAVFSRPLSDVTLRGKLVYQYQI
jgi:hypothetical protein